MTMKATPRAERASAFWRKPARLGKTCVPSQTRASPQMTTPELQTSVEKWSASASSAWLECRRATLDSILDRLTSTPTETAITANAQRLGSTVRG